jgi:hypothetical protein
VAEFLQTWNKLATRAGLGVSQAKVALKDEVKRIPNKTGNLQRVGMLSNSLEWWRDVFHPTAVSSGHSLGRGSSVTQRSGRLFGR